MKTEPLSHAQPSLAYELRHISPQQASEELFGYASLLCGLCISPTPTESFQGLPQYNFDVGSPTQTSPPTPVSSPKPHLQFDPQYTMPPIKTLPSEFNRRGKISKQLRKKEKEREKGETKKDKDDYIPMGLNRWGFTINANFCVEEGVKGDEMPHHARLECKILFSSVWAYG